MLNLSCNILFELYILNLFPLSMHIKPIL